MSQRLKHLSVWATFLPAGMSNEDSSTGGSPMEDSSMEDSPMEDSIGKASIDEFFDWQGTPPPRRRQHSRKCKTPHTRKASGRTAGARLFAGP